MMQLPRAELILYVTPSQYDEIQTTLRQFQLKTFFVKDAHVLFTTWMMERFPQLRGRIVGPTNVRFKLVRPGDPPPSEIDPNVIT